MADWISPLSNKALDFDKAVLMCAVSQACWEKGKEDYKKGTGQAGRQIVCSWKSVGF